MHIYTVYIYMVSTPWGACEQNAHFDVKTQTIANFCKIQAGETNSFRTFAAHLC